MKTRVLLSFNIEKPLWSVVRNLLKDAEPRHIVITEPYTEPLFNSYCAVSLDETDPRLPRLRAILSEAGIDWLERRELLFTKAELEAAPLLWLTFGTKPGGSIGPKYRTEYDLSHACPRCGTGAIQVSPLRLNPAEIPRKGTIFQTFDNEKLVSAELAKAFSNAEVTGLELRTAQSFRNLTDLPWVQLLAEVEMPPMLPSSKGISRDAQCLLCGRDGYFNSGYEPTVIQYGADQVILDNLPDAVHTYEHFGYSRLEVPFKNSYLAQPLLLVKPKVFRIFRQQKVRGAKFIPVNSASSERAANGI